MREIKLKGLDATAYNETLDNGLEIFLLPYENKKNYCINYVTRFGSEIASYNKDNKTIELSDGIAHFLEHKLFEQESGEDPFEFFQKSGTEVNAGTNYEYTQYYCCGTKSFRENLRYLIQFVNAPYFTDEAVEKEKNIIIEEIKMYNDCPESRLDNKLRESTYIKSKRAIDIAGTIDSVKKINKKELLDTYKAFYRPNNMFIFVVGKFKINDALEVIKEELKDKKSIDDIEINKIDEPVKVNKKNVILKDNIESSKLAFAMKIDVSKLELDDIELDLYLSMLSNVLFGSSSLFREKTIKNKLLNGITTYWENVDIIRVFNILGTNVFNSKEVIKEIKDTFNNINISEEDFNRTKKVWIANEVRVIDDLAKADIILLDEIINYRRIIPNKIDLIKNMKLSKLNNMINKIDFDNISIVEMIKK